MGTQTLTITQGNPTADYTASVKISPVITAPDPIQQGLYQTDYSARADAVFATSANVTTTSTIYKLDPDTLAVQKSVVPAFVNGTDGALWAAYGIGVDDTNGTVWVSQTRQNTVAVYSQDDLSLIKQFPAGTTTHSRDVVYDPASDQVFVSSASEGSSGDGYISVFNAKTLEKVKDVQTGARTVFSPVSLALDESTDTLYSVSLTTSRLGVLDTKSLNFTTLDLPGLPAGSKASGVAIDEKTNRVYVASQNADSLLIADAATGATVAQVATGAGALNVAFDPVNRLRGQLRRHHDLGRGRRRHAGGEPALRSSQPCGGGRQGFGVRGEQGHGQHRDQDHPEAGRADPGRGQHPHDQRRRRGRGNVDRSTRQLDPGRHPGLPVVTCGRTDRRRHRHDLHPGRGRPRQVAHRHRDRHPGRAHGDQQDLGRRHGERRHAEIGDAEALGFGQGGQQGDRGAGCVDLRHKVQLPVEAVRLVHQGRHRLDLHAHLHAALPCR